MRRPLPPEEIEFFPESKLEKKLVKLQSQFLKENKSIWGTDYCERCGVCCYKYEIKTLDKPEQYTLCNNLKIENNVPYCEIQKDKPELCENYTCKGRGTRIERWQMLQMSEKILETKTIEDLEEVAKIHLLTYEEIIKIEGQKREKEFNQLSPKEKAKRRKTIKELLEMPFN